MARMQTLSIRLPDEDFNWLVSLPESGARTPSEKLRALLQQAREQQQGMLDPERCTAWMRQLIQPFVDEMGLLDDKDGCFSHITHEEDGKKALNPCCDFEGREFPSIEVFCQETEVAGFFLYVVEFKDKGMWVWVKAKPRKLCHRKNDACPVLKVRF